MSLRALIRIAALALGLLVAAPLLWKVAGPWALVGAPGLALLSGAYLALQAALEKKAASRWQIRYVMAGREPQTDERLSAILDFLAGRGASLTLEANHQGLFLEAPPAYDRYIPAQLVRTLPEAKIVKIEASPQGLAQELAPAAGGNLYLLTGLPGSDLLRWATEGQERQVRLHLRRGGYTALACAANGSRPPGSWLPLALPGPLAAAAWRRAPVWDELAGDVPPGRLLPTTDEQSPFSSRSRLPRLASAAALASGDRQLGQAADGRPVCLERGTPLLTVGAPAAFLAGQVKQDLAAGRAVVVISPHRRILNRVQRGAGTMTYWLDQENARLSVHLPVITGAEWADHPAGVEAVVDTVEGFLDSLGLRLVAPIMRALARDLIGILAASARATGNDFAFTDLYAVAQSTATLKAFLDDLARIAVRLEAGTVDTVRRLLDTLADRSGYAQVTAVLSTLRTALGTIRSGSLHALCRPPFLNAAQALGGSHLLLVPTTDADFPEHNRFLAAMVDAALHRVLAADPDLRLALHLHDPHLYSADGGRRWLDLARRDSRLSLLVDVQDPDRYSLRLQATRREGRGEGEVIFRCSEALASTLIGDWGLDYTPVEMTEIPEGTALARLPGLPGPVVIQVDGCAAEGA